MQALATSRRCFRHITVKCTSLKRTQLFPTPPTFQSFLPSPPPTCRTTAPRCTTRAAHVATSTPSSHSYTTPPFLCPTSTAACASSTARGGSTNLPNSPSFNRNRSRPPPPQHGFSPTRRTSAEPAEPAPPMVPPLGQTLRGIRSSGPYTAATAVPTRGVAGTAALRAFSCLVPSTC